MEAVRPSQSLPPYRHENKLKDGRSIPVDVAPVPLPAGLAAIRRHRPNDTPA